MVRDMSWLRNIFDDPNVPLRTKIKIYAFFVSLISIPLIFFVALYLPNFEKSRQNLYERLFVKFDPTEYVQQCNDMMIASHGAATVLSKVVKKDYVSVSYRVLDEPLPITCYNNGNELKLLK